MIYLCRIHPTIDIKYRLPSGVREWANLTARPTTSQVSWKIGGQQGEGLESTDRIFSTVLNRLGYYLYGYRHFSSRIKGGHTNNKIRISTHPIRSISDDLDILVAFDQETIAINCQELRSGGVVIADAKFNPTLPDGVRARLIAVPFTQIAEGLGTSLMKNMVAAGASAALLGLPIDVVNEVVAEVFARKGAKVVSSNTEAVSQGAAFMQEAASDLFAEFELHVGDGKQRLFMIGNEAIALGAISAGCRFMPAYPITPASEIMEYMIQHLPKFGGTVIQTEDEIAALTMAIGANYGGVRAMTASAGPGLSLMTEGIGLAGMTETPVVIVDTQRGGPSTGLPTKQEQSDLNALVYGTHGEIPKIVIAPSTVEDCFYDTMTAFNLADQYQCPVIIMTDLQLSLGKQSAEMLDHTRIPINQGKVAHTPDPLPQGELFERFAITEDGISPRALPGTEHGLTHITGVEHDTMGRPSEDAVNRKAMMDKRLRKLENFVLDEPIRVSGTNANPDVLIVGMGSTDGTIAEARSRLDADGICTNQIIVRQIYPFPITQLLPHIQSANTIVVVENNATAQLAMQIKLHCDVQSRLRHLLKYDGTPFLPSEIYEYCKELI